MEKRQDHIHTHFLNRWGVIFVCGPKNSPVLKRFQFSNNVITPDYNAGKMKAMMVFINETGNRLITTMDKLAESGEDFETKHVLGKFSMDTIASCAFGVDAKVHETEDSIFVKYAGELFKQGPILVQYYFNSLCFRHLSIAPSDLNQSGKIRHYYSFVFNRSHRFFRTIATR